MWRRTYVWKGSFYQDVLPSGVHTLPDSPYREILEEGFRPPKEAFSSFGLQLFYDLGQNIMVRELAVLLKILRRFLVRQRRQETREGLRR